MNTSQLSKYAPEARKAFIAAVSAQAGRLGITPKEVADAQVQGDILLIDGQPFPASIAPARDALTKRISAHGFDPTLEAIAYTWFNRFAAIRYMELHGYLDHGYRVLSHPEAQGRPEILDHAADVDLPGLDRDRAVELKLDGTKDEELYRLLLLAQCNALHQAMPFLFEEIGDETELLLPANLLHTDSLIRQLVEQVNEALWQEIEIIGWLYQFYTSEKKDQVIGKVVKSEDIPAATQLFTPNWIVKYMVQNSLGAQWLATYPQSPLKGQMEYYIEPADQTDEVNAQLAAITPSQLNPEELTLIDPASGSGHILVEAYELFKAIYLERGYRQRDVPQLILEKNLFGLDIDERAAQLTGFALMMKGRADDRRLFERGVKLNVMTLVDSAGFDAERLAQGVELGDYGLKPEDLMELKRLFEHATTFGSLIQVPEGMAEELPALKRLSEATSQDLFVSEALKRFSPLVQQAQLLAAQYDAVVANPPYLSAKGMTSQVKSYLRAHFPVGQKDTFSAFMLRAVSWAASGNSALSLVTPFAWMYLSTFEKLRRQLCATSTLKSLVELETNAFQPAMVTVCAFVISPQRMAGYSGCYIRLSSFKGHQNQAPRTLDAINNRDCGWFFETPQEEFEKIPGGPIAYWMSDRFRNVFELTDPLEDFALANQGLATADNEQFLRRWNEVALARVGFGMSSCDAARRTAKKWFPYNKGGEFRKWYGNQEYLVNWEADGREIRVFGSEDGGRPRSRAQNTDAYFRPSVSWSRITSLANSFREYPPGFIHDQGGHSAFGGDISWRCSLLAFCNTKFASLVTKVINPTLNFEVGDFNKIPYAIAVWTKETVEISEFCVALSTEDWNAYERSWDFQSLPLLPVPTDPTPTLESSYTAWITQNRDTIAEMKRLEEENNRLFIDAYGLADELTPDVPIEQITLTVNPAYRYGGKLTEEEQWTRFRLDTLEELVSYAIGCMMGRYPFGTFLLWRVEAENSDQYKFYDFVRDYHERDRPHCPSLLDITFTSIMCSQKPASRNHASARPACRKKMWHCARSCAMGSRISSSWREPRTSKNSRPCRRIGLLRCIPTKPVVPTTATNTFSETYPLNSLTSRSFSKSAERDCESGSAGCSNAVNR